jgi:putative DNA primase/helicase
VPAEFLMKKGAYTLKKLVGHDLLTPEGKNLNSAINMRGDFGVVITCNSRLRVRLEGDSDAWRRRLMLIEYKRPKPEKRITNFAQFLLKKESSGILNWMLEGALAHLAELKEFGDFVLTEGQRERVDALLAESDSVRAFVQRCLRPAHPGATVTTEELVQTYAAFCSKMDWHPSAPTTVEKQLPDLVLEIHGVHKRNDIKTSWGTQRGFKGLEITPDYES